MVAAPKTLYPAARTQEVLLALRELLSRNRCAAHFDSETLSELLHEERCLSYRPAIHELECALEALRIEGEVLG